MKAYLTPEERLRRARAATKKWAKENSKQQSHTMRVAALRRNYGLTLAQVEFQTQKQNQCCAICGETTKLHVDHCHVDKSFRGMLCSPCNTALGLLKDSPFRIQQALDYILSGGVV